MKKPTLLPSGSPRARTGRWATWLTSQPSQRACETPFSDPLFIEDKSHDSYYPSAKLSPVIGQVIRYICEVERNRDSIISKDGYDPLKIRARVIVGRDGDANQQEALRNLNAHLHRIEILTFDQLARISARALEMFESTSGLDDSGADEASEPPF